MDTLSYKTVSANKATVNKEWVIIDAQGETLGRLASVVAKFIRGKYKTNFTPHVDCGDNVIVINADKVQLSGQKMQQKEYYHHSGYPGGQKFTSVARAFNKKPEFIIQHAVKGMLPKNKLGNALFKNLYVYVGAEHKHEAQKPREVKLNSIK